MKYIYTFFLSLILIACHAQVAMNYRQVPTGSIYGTIYSASQWANLSAFTINGCTASASSNNINISAISPNLNNESLDLNGNTMLEYWRIFCRYTINSATSSTSSGLAIGIRSSSGADATTHIGLITSSDATYGGHLVLTSVYPSPVTVVSSTGTISFSNGDSIELTCERSGNFFIATARNATTNSAIVTISYSFTTNVVGDPLLPNTGKFALFARGGSQIVDSLSIVSREIITPDLMVIGDSKTVGLYSVYETRWATLLKSGMSQLVVHAGGGDRASDVLTTITEILSGKPKRALLELGTNDTDTATFKTNYASIVSQLQAAGIDVYHTCFYQSATSNLWRWNYLLRTYPAANIIDTYTPLQVNGALASDNVHPSSYGDSLIANAIIGANKFSGSTAKVTVSQGFDVNATHTWTALQTFNAGVATKFVDITSFTPDYDHYGLHVQSGGGLVFATHTTTDFRWITGTTQVMGITSTGAVLINQLTNPNSDQLAITGNIGATSFLVRAVSSDANTYGAYVNSSGYVLSTVGSTALQFRVNNTPVGNFGSTGNFTVNALGTGALYSNLGVLTNTNPSDIRLKNSIENYPYGLREILQLSPKQYYYNSDTKRSDLNAGFLAQDVLKVMPSMVRQMQDGYLGLKSDMIIPALVNAIQELQTEIDYLKKELKKH